MTTGRTRPNYMTVLNNPEIKKLYLDAAAPYSEIYFGVFRKACEYEKKFGKDLNSFNKQEAIEFLKGYNARSVASLSAVVSHCANYMEFCQDLDIKGSENGCWREIIKADIEDCIPKERVSKQFLTPQQIKMILADLYNPCDRFLILGFYEGLNGENREELWGLKLEDIDIKNCIFHLPTRKLQVSKDLAHTALASAKTFTYTSIGRRVVEYQLEPDSNYVIKNKVMKHDATLDGDPLYEYRRISQRMDALQDQISIKDVTLKRVRDSGIVNNIIQIAGELEIKPIEVLDTPRFKEIRERFCLESPLYSLRRTFEPYLNSVTK